MTAQTKTHHVVFRVLDIMPGAHQGWLLRLRLQSGDAPSIRDLKGARMRLENSGGATLDLVINGFPLMGGKPSDGRLARSGRLDVQAVPADSGNGAPPIMAGSWELSGPLT